MTYENTRVREQVLKIAHCLIQTKFLIISRTTEYDCTYEHYLLIIIIIIIIFFFYFADRASQYIYFLISTNLMH